MSTKTFTRLFYIHRFLFDFIFIYAVEKLFMQSRGLDLGQIGVLLFLWSLMTVLFEVPSGAIADRWSRRKMLILSGLFFSLCYLVWIFSTSFWLFLFGFFLRTLGSTFASGTLQAYMYDFLKQKGSENLFEKIWGRGNALRTLGIGVAVAFGGFLSEISYSLVLALSSLSVFSISLIAVFWPEIPITKSTKETKYWQFIKQSFQTVGSNKTLLNLMFYTALALALWASLEEFNDIYLNFLGYSRTVIGLVFALAGIFQSLASSIAYKFKDKSWLIINFSVIYGVLALVAASAVKHPLMVIPILSLGVLLEFISVLKQGLIQKQTQSFQRATVSSVDGLIMNIIPYQLVFGFFANRQGLQTSYLILGLFSLTYFIIYLIPKFKFNSAKT